MRNFYLFYLISRLTGNPLVALLVIATIYLVVDRQFIGLLPDFTRPFRSAARLRQLLSTIELNPANAGAQLEVGSLYFERGQYEKALPHLEQAARKLDDHATALFYLGAARVALGKRRAGREALDKAVHLRANVQYGEPYVYLVRAATEGGRFHDSEETLGEWVSTVLRYGNAEVCYVMGQALVQADRSNEAAQMFRETLNNYKQNPVFARKTARRWALRAWWALRQIGSKKDGRPS